MAKNKDNLQGVRHKAKRVYKKHRAKINDLNGKICVVCKKYRPPEALAYNGDIELNRCWACHVKLSRHRWERLHGLRPKREMDKCSFRTYAHRLFESVEFPQKDMEGYLLARCSTCGRHFHPSISAVTNRISAIESETYSSENRLYCSDKCKSNCHVFNRKGYNFRKKPTFRNDQAALREMVLERDGQTCQICGSKTRLICHHVTGTRQNPIESTDLDNCVTVCHNCHSRIHSEVGCRPSDLRCKDIYRVVP